MGEYSLSEAIQSFLAKSRIKGSIQSFQIEEMWEEIMGKTIARYTESIKIFGDKLVIRTDVAPLRNELVYQKEKILARVNEALGENKIKEVIIQ